MARPPQWGWSARRIVRGDGVATRWTTESLTDLSSVRQGCSL
ncbi:hypothetical protein [Neokomagataea tanensis]|nr:MULTISPECIES: hypothetical protein [Neokomagataea]